MVSGENKKGLKMAKIGLFELKGHCSTNLSYRPIPRFVASM
jgi:hypothetical protein